MKTWVYIDHFKGEVVSASWEAIGVGKTFGPVTALVFGSGVEALAQAAFELARMKSCWRMTPLWRISAPRRMPPL